MKKLKIGLVGLMHKNFPGNKEISFKESIESFEELSKKYNFEPHIIRQGVIIEKDAEIACKKLREQNIDFLMVLNIQFASGRIISTLSKLEIPLGLWALPENKKEGPLPNNSFCGMNMNASILKEYLVRNNYKWFYGKTNHKWFVNRFAITIAALQAIKNMHNSKMLIIGGMADGFDNQYYDERKIYERFKVRVLRNLEFDDVYNRVNSYSTKDIEEIIEKINEDICYKDELSVKKINKTACLIKALTEISTEMELSAITLNCWPKFRQKLGMVPCAAIGFLNKLGIITACEGDVYGMLSMYIIRQLSTLPTLLMDLINFDEDDQSLLFWHCGVGSTDLAYKGDVKLISHSNPSCIPGCRVIKHAPVADMIYRKGKATVLRITKEGSQLFLLNGEFINPEKPSFDGSRGWLNKLRLNNVSINISDLINTILIEGVQHHYVIGLGDYSNEILEIAIWLGIKPIEKIEYHDYLQ